MEADQLSGDIWNAIADMVRRSTAPREIVYSNIKKVDKKNKVIFVEDYSETPIPLTSFAYTFAYFDTLSTGVVQKRYDPTSGSDPAYLVTPVMPRVGQRAIILDPRGNGRFPVCIGVIVSEKGSYWQGELSA